MAWGVPKIGTVATVASGNITLTEPSGIASDDLMIACIAYRSNAAFTVPGGWNLVATQQSSGDTDATNGIASGVMMWTVRGGSAPTLTFNRTAGDVAIGCIIAYPGGHASAPYDTGSADTASTAVTTMNLSQISTAEAGELIVVMTSAGDTYNVSAFDSFGAWQTTNSGATDTTSAPANGVFFERVDQSTGTGADTGLGIGDAIKAASGATDSLRVTFGGAARHVMICGAFKLAASGAALAGTINAVSTGAGVLAITRNLSGAVNAAATKAGVLQNIKSLAGQLDAASTVSGTLAIGKQLAGAINAASTGTGVLAITKNLAGSLTAGSSASGDLSVGMPPVLLAGSIDAASTVSGSVTITKSLAGAVNAASTVAGTARLTFSLGGAINGAAGVSGTLKLTRNLAGQLAPQSTVSGSLGIGHNLAGTVNAQSAASAVLLVGNIQPLAGAVNGQSTVSGTIKLGMSLAGAAAAQSTATGFLGQTIHVGGAVNAQSTLTGSLRLGLSLSGAVNAIATTDGVLYSGSGYMAVSPLTYSLLSGRHTLDLELEQNIIELTNGRNRVTITPTINGIALDPGKRNIELGETI